MSTYLYENDIEHQIYCEYTPQQNGMAEWKNKHLLEVTRAILGTNVPIQFWSEAVINASYYLILCPLVF